MNVVGVPKGLSSVLGIMGGGGTCAASGAAPAAAAGLERIVRATGGRARSPGDEIVLSPPPAHLIVVNRRYKKAVSLSSACASVTIIGVAGTGVWTLLPLPSPVSLSSEGVAVTGVRARCGVASTAPPASPQPEAL